MLTIENYIQHFIQIWEESDNSFPGYRNSYNKNEQLQRENNFLEFQQKINKLKSAKTVNSIRKSDPGKSFFPMFKAFLENVFDFEKEHLNIILSDKFKNVSKDFFYKAREFGPELSPENIYQGLRNVWIMNGIQLMMDLPVEITPSIFAYSMIYPYSDNYLDDLSVSSEEKRDFSIRFNNRLHGFKVVPKNYTEEQLFKLVAMFEGQYPREDFPDVYNSLYAIQKGQTNSLKLICKNGMPKSEIQYICFEKGGASVLADGYLVAGKLTKEQEQALFGYGIYLQLLDDIQDVKEDLDAETKTMFSGNTHKSLDNFVNQTIHFGRTALEEMKCFNTSDTDIFLDLMNRSIETMIIESIGMNPVYYSNEFLQKLVKHSPLRFEFVRKIRSKAKSQRFSIFKRYFEQNQPEEIKV